MKLEILCQVTALAAKERYPNKPGSTEPDYLKKKQGYTESTIGVLPNDKAITGEITIEGEMKFGQIVRLTLDTETSPETVTGSLVAEHAE